MRAFILLLTVSWLTCCCFAQDVSTGAIRGVVVDPSSRRIANASIVLINDATGLRYEHLSDSTGQFAFDFLSPGDYSARVTAEHMAPQVSPNLHVTVGAVTEVDFKLTVASVQESVTVSAEPKQVEMEPRGLSSVVDERAIQELPLNGRRFTDLALLTPGVTQDPRGQNSTSNGDLAFGGVRGFQTSYLVDGGDNNNGFFSQARGRYRAPYQFSNEVIREFRVSTNAGSAETGRAGGAVVNVVTKSGSNKFHGTGFYYVRNSSFDARPAGLDVQPASQQHQFGFTFGGPIRRNRVFFFGGFDQHIFHAPTVVRFIDGSRVVRPQPAAGPATPGDYEASDQTLVFAAAAQLSKQAGYYPSELLGNSGFAKLDVALSPRHQLSVRLNTSRYSGSNNVFLDPSSPITTYGISDNGTEHVATETITTSLTSAFSVNTISSFRAQFSRDLQWSESNSNQALTRIPGIIDGFGRSTILPRQTLEHRLHFAETVSREEGRHAWKFGGDALFTFINNYFPSMFGGEYIFSPIKVDPFTFQPMMGGMPLTPLRAYSHEVPHYYVQRFGSAISHPNSNDYAAFVQDTMRPTQNLGLSLGVRYDVQTFSRKYLQTNPLWPDSGKVPLDLNNFAPRAGISYAFGNDRPLIARLAYGLFHTRIPQIYSSAIETDSGLVPNSIFLNQTNYYDRQIFPQYPSTLVQCASLDASCTLPPSLMQFAQSDISAFARNFRTPEVHQASLTLEREVANRVVAQLSYSYVHGQDLIRARDVNLPKPTNVQYPIYDSSGLNVLGLGNVETFSTWQFSQSLTCPYPPCINPLGRPVPQLGSIDVFESAGSSVYHGATLSIKRQMTHGLYFRLAYTYAHAIDDGQDALVAGRPATVQNSYSPSSERGNSVTDQRQRFVFSWIYEPHALNGGHGWTGKFTKGWRSSGVTTVGSGRPVNAQVVGDANQDGNSDNDRLPGLRRNSIYGPNYSTADMRLSRRLYVRKKIRLDFGAESFNLFNRLNRRFELTDDGALSNAAQFLYGTKQIGSQYYPAYYQVPTNFMKANRAYAPRQVQFSLRLGF
jgi:hypothetical protein